MKGVVGTMLNVLFVIFGLVVFYFCIIVPAISIREISNSMCIIANELQEIRRMMKGAGDEQETQI